MYGVVIATYKNTKQRTKIVKGDVKMVLRMCDVCRKIQKPSSVMSVQLTIPSDEIVYQKKNGQFFPDYRFLTENELNELKKDR